MSAFLDWEKLRNPVFACGDWTLKDACMVRHHGVIYVFFSAIFQDAGQLRFHLAAVKTRDFLEFSEPLFVWDGVDHGTRGIASSDIKLIEGKYYLSYCTFRETRENRRGEPEYPPNQLFYRESTDLETWSAPRPLAAELTSSHRAIDPAISFHGDRYFLFYKANQEPRLASAPSMDGPWRLEGLPEDDTFIENTQFLDIAEGTYLIGTSRLWGEWDPTIIKVPSLEHQPEQLWRNFAGRFERLVIPGEQWNRATPHNAIFVADWRDLDGHFYAIFCGRSHSGSGWHSEGDYRLGLARSRDLAQWEIPGVPR